MYIAKLLKDFIFSTKLSRPSWNVSFTHSVQRITSLTTVFINGNNGYLQKNSGSSGKECSLWIYFGVFFTGIVLNRVLTDNIVINEKAMRSKKNLFY